jgi:hypothetical protein
MDCLAASTCRQQAATTLRAAVTDWPLMQQLLWLHGLPSSAALIANKPCKSKFKRRKQPRISSVYVARVLQSSAEHLLDTCRTCCQLLTVPVPRSTTMLPESCMLPATCCTAVRHQWGTHAIVPECLHYLLQGSGGSACFLARVLLLLLAAELLPNLQNGSKCSPCLCLGPPQCCPLCRCTWTLSACKSNICDMLDIC